MGTTASAGTGMGTTASASAGTGMGTTASASAGTGMGTSASWVSVSVVLGPIAATTLPQLA